MFNPKYIEIKGVQFVNKGAELMLHAILQQIEINWPKAKVVLAPNPFSPYSKRIEVNAFQKLSIRKSHLDLNSFAHSLPEKLRKKLIHSWGVVTEADIDLVLDASGFAYGDQWGSLKIKHLAAELKRYNKHNTTYVFLPQAFGPFNREQDVKRLQDALPLATFIAAREKTSFSNIKKLASGNLSNLFQFPDFTNLVTGQLPGYYPPENTNILLIPNSNMIGEKNTHKPDWKNNYLSVISSAIDVVRDLGFTPILLNHEGNDDLELCHSINARAKDPVEIIEEQNPLKVKGIIGASKAVICSRFHGCVSALSQGIPCIGTSWSHKYEHLFEEYGVSDCLLEPTVNSDQLANILKTALSSKSELELQERAGQLKKDSHQLWQSIVKVLSQ